MNARKLMARRAARGFTLLEMMLVVVIIGVLATIVVSNLLGKTDEAFRTATIAKLSEIKANITQYYSKNGQYPATLQTLATGPNPLLEKVPKDGWKRDFVYLMPAREADKPFTLYSVGKDGLPNTADDISVWNMES